MIKRPIVIGLIITLALSAAETTLGSAQGLSQYKDSFFRKGSAVAISEAANEFEALLKLRADGVRQSVGNNKMCMVHIFREERDSLNAVTSGDHYIVDVGTLSNQIEVGNSSLDKHSKLILLRTADGASTILRIFSATSTRSEGSERVANFFVSVPTSAAESGIRDGVAVIRTFSSLCVPWW